MLHINKQFNSHFFTGDMQSDDRWHEHLIGGHENFTEDPGFLTEGHSHFTDNTQGLEHFTEEPEHSTKGQEDLTKGSEHTPEEESSRPFKSKSTAQTMQKRALRRGGIADECCIRKGCTIDELRSYCM